MNLAQSKYPQIKNKIQWKLEMQRKMGMENKREFCFDSLHIMRMNEDHN
jgi:hypothetical protein